MCASLGGLDADDNACGDLAVRMMVEQGLAVEAIDPANGNERVGVFLCQVYEKGAPNGIDEAMAKVPMDDKMERIGEFLDYTKRFVHEEIYGRQGKEAFLEGMMINVKEGHNGRGIAQLLTNAIIDLARELKISVVYVGCSSEFTARVMVKMGFKEICRVAFADYRPDGGRFVFSLKEPHTHFKGYMMLLD